MKLELVVYPNDALQTKITEEWNFENPQYNAEELRTEMLRIMVENKGIGLSANQVGINVRAFVFVNSLDNNSDRQNTLALNPTYEVHKDSVDIDMWESCLSYPGALVQIIRPNKITANWFDQKNKKRTFVLDGYSARCFIHETDHLNGVTMDEHVLPKVWKEALTKANLNA